MLHILLGIPEQDSCQAWSHCKGTLENGLVTCICVWLQVIEAVQRVVGVAVPA